MSIASEFWEGIKNTSVLEWIGIATALAYVILAAKRHIACWFFALVSASIYVILCIKAQYYIESGLQFFFVVMAIVGWLSWNKSASVQTPEIHVWKWQLHLLNIVLSGIAAALIGYFFDTFTDQENPYVDAFTTVYSLVATFMVTQKVLENWLYWVVIDAVSIYLYAYRGYYSTSLLYVFYTVLAIVGFVMWLRQYRLQQATPQ